MFMMMMMIVLMMMVMVNYISDDDPNVFKLLSLTSIEAAILDTIKWRKDFRIHKMDVRELIYHHNPHHHPYQHQQNHYHYDPHHYIYICIYFYFTTIDQSISSFTAIWFCIYL